MWQNAEHDDVYLKYKMIKEEVQIHNLWILWLNQRRWHRRLATLILVKNNIWERRGKGFLVGYKRVGSTASMAREYVRLLYISAAALECSLELGEKVSHSADRGACD
jgi:hypothetical protein